MHLFVFGYPFHYHILQLAIKSAVRYINNITDITIVWDDFGFKKIQPLNLSTRLQKLLPKIEIIQTSKLDYCINESNGWVRQQYVKLNLHHITQETCILLDGDTVLRNPVEFFDPQGNILIHGDPHEYYQPYFDFIFYTTGLEKGSTKSFMSPYWVCEPDVLTRLEQFIFDKHGANLTSVFKQYCNNNIMPPLSEVELYGLFAQSLGRPMRWVDRNLICCDRNQFLKYWNDTTNNLCLGGRDNFPSDWWAEQGIEYQHDIDQALNC